MIGRTAARQGAARRGGRLALCALGVGIATAATAHAISFSSDDYPVPTSYGLVVGDFDRDGRKDLVAIGHDENAYYLEGKAGGQFEDPVTVPSVGTGWGGVGGRFDGDNKLDLLIADQENADLVLLLGNGDGTFQAPDSFGVGSSPQSPAAADFNRDGNLDAAVANSGEPSVSILLGDGAGSFAPAEGYQVGGAPYAVDTGHFNSDNRPDIVSADDQGNSFSVLLARANGTFKPAETTDALGPEDVVSGDFNGDGRDDVATADYGVASVSIFLRKGNAEFKKPKTFNAVDSTWHIDAGFLNGDRDLDVVAGNESSPGGVSAYIGNGDGTLQRQKKLDKMETYSPVAIADFDGRRGGDIAAGYDAGGVTVFLNEG